MLIILILLSFTTIFASNQCNLIIDRVDCSSGVGSQNQVHNLTKHQCNQRGCCYDSTNFQCYFNSEGKTIKTIHMINSNHFDAGYANLTVDIVNVYFDTYFQRAADVGAQLRSSEHTGKVGSGPLKWMTFSWLISLFFDCPPGMDIHCPTKDQMTNISNAIAAHDIVWPAMPHNAELATGDPSMLTFGVKLSKNLAQKFNGSVPSVVSTRDVPGMPRASLKILKDAGVTALSEGMNGRMVPVNVPPSFVWVAKDGETSMPTLWHWHGYGQIGEPGNPIRIPGSEHALCYCWRGDNEGPPLTAEEVLTNAIAISIDAGRPNVTVVSSTLSDYTNEIQAENAWSNVPRITSDLSDSWIWGVGSDPIKVTRMRSLLRARTKCELNDAPTFCGYNDTFYTNFSRLALKNMEHTWGVSVSHYGSESDTHWSNIDFHHQLATNEPHLKVMVDSWIEQRNWGINYALDALPMDHPVKIYATKDIEETSSVGIPEPIKEGFTKVIFNPDKPLHIGGYYVLFDDNGGIQSLVDENTMTEWVNNRTSSKTASIGVYKYQTLIENDFIEWRKVYLIPNTGGDNEYGKPPSFMNSKPTPIHQTVAPNLQNVYVNSRTGEALLQMKFTDTSLHTNYGAPGEIWTRWTFGKREKITIRLLLLNKTATRLPEATYFSFNPMINDKDATWQHSILNEWSDPNDIAEGATKGLHYVDDQGVCLKSNNTKQAIYINTLDAGLLRWGEPLPFPTPLSSTIDTSIGPSFCLSNNIWNTNYPDWMPFDTIGSNMVFRFELTLIPATSTRTTKTTKERSVVE